MATAIARSDFPDAVGPRDPVFDPERREHPGPEHIMADAARNDDRVYRDDPAPPAVHVSDRNADVISLDTVRSAMVANFEPDDLDVPAFLRKRNEVM